MAFRKLPSELGWRSHCEDEQQTNNLKGLRQTLLNSSVYAGQGPDHWVLRHWAFLPDEALRQLALIIFMMEQGAVPAQALLVYVGFIPKATISVRYSGTMQSKAPLLCGLPFFAPFELKFQPCLGLKQLEFCGMSLPFLTAYPLQSLSRLPLSKDILGMAIRTHMGPRAFKEGTFISSWYVPGA